MKPFCLSVFFFLTSTLAYAEEFTCTFTEPFLELIYDSEAKVLRVIDLTTEGSDEPRRGLSMRSLGPNEYVVEDAEGREHLRMKLDYEGEDGMSEKVYPYSAIHTGENAFPLHGGCTSSKDEGPAVF